MLLLTKEAHRGRCNIQPNPININRQVFLLRGLGCRKHPNCFECSERDCKMPDNQVTTKTSHRYIYTDGLVYSERPI